MNCDTVVSQLPLMLYGELSFDEEEALQQHLDVCASCTGELARLRRLHHELNVLEPDVPAQLLQDSRRSLRVTVSALQDAGLFRKKQSWAAGLLIPLRQWGAGWKAAGATALLITGFFSGRMFPKSSYEGRLSVSGSEPVASRVRFVQPEASGRVQIVLEEVRQRVLEGGVNDDGIRGILLSAAREANDPGVRVETMDLLKDQSASSEVRSALLSALQHDGNPGVRLKALEALKMTAHDADTRRVLTHVLLTDQNPGIRTQAIDLLVQQHEPEIVGILQELVSREDNDYVRLKCQKALREMNASVETF